MKNSLAKALRSARMQSGLTQVELANRSNVSLATIQNIETDRANPEWNTLEQLFATLNMKFTLHVKEIDWNELSGLGCPLAVESIETSARPDRRRLTEVLQALSLQVDGVKNETRESSALIAWLKAIEDHFPSVWKEVPRSIKKFSSQHLDYSRKLRRIALQRLGGYL